MGFQQKPGTTNDGAAGGAFWPGSNVGEILQQQVNQDAQEILAAKEVAVAAAAEAVDSKDAAALSETNAGISEDNAAASALSASNDADTAVAQAGIATTQAGIATTQAGIATTKASEANSSAIAADLSAQDAADSAVAADQSAQDAAASASVINPANFVDVSTNQTINGVKTFTQDIVGDITGTAAAWTTPRTLSYSGDATGSNTVDGSANVNFALTLANSGVAAGTYNNVATSVRPFTVDAKGRITSIGAAVTITPAFADVTGKPTTLSGYGIVDAVFKTGSTGSAALPVGTTAQRDGTPQKGYIRFNDTTTNFEGYNGTAWGSIGGGATGGIGNAVFYENDQAVTADYTITSNKNAMSAGPITINTGITVTVPSGSTWTIV